MGGGEGLGVGGEVGWWEGGGVEGDEGLGWGVKLGGGRGGGG